MCTLEKRGRVWLLTLGGDADHRLSPGVLDSLNSALDRIRAESSSGTAALVVAGTGKFFSYGFDLEWAKSGPFMPRMHLMSDKFRTLVSSLVSLPIPTIAAVTGHAAAAGFMLVLAHDYIVMRRDRGFLYMSELDLGLPFEDFMMALIRAKVPSPAALRDVVLRARKFTASEAADAGIVHMIASDAGETVAEAVRLAEDLAGRNWDGNVYSSIRKAAFPEIAAALGLVNGSGTKVASKL
ncbi:enoyl-CoA delta isomerase 2, peroxisomal-like [Nymphaea colorata]|uniref:Delta(3)-Delta(2)-enoyl-CoA isomerase n=1 Tax=Nymphaea colorata TaxID=210225 RepID=A0A5K0Z454_9MAGN|nr:enoyl-CoA delta isomerase 2, peroxisomal-like [Nymphaea colorata]